MLGLREGGRESATEEGKGKRTGEGEGGALDR